MSAARAEIPRPTRRTDTGERLVRIGTEFLSEKGFGLTGLDEVLRAADVPKGSFYYYFDSKIDFGLAVIDNYAGIWARKLKRLLENPSVLARCGASTIISTRAFPASSATPFSAAA